MARKLIKWFIFSVVIAGLPVIIQAAIFYFNGDELSRVSLFSDGELFIIASAMAAAAIGDILADRRYSGPVSTAQLVAIGFTLVVAVLSAAVYSSTRPEVSPSASMTVKVSELKKEAAELARRQERAANASLMVMVLALAASSTCVALSEER